MQLTFWAYARIVYFAVISGMADDEIHEDTNIVINVLGYLHSAMIIFFFLWGETLLLEGSLSEEYDGRKKTCESYIQELKKQTPVKTMSVGAYHFNLYIHRR